MGERGYPFQSSLIAMSLRGQVAVVTGASRGIGRGIALQLGAAGAKVYVTGRKPSCDVDSSLPTLESVAQGMYFVPFLASTTAILQR